eukprot:CAMPEP_0170611608 /NCGR_PEP_ID=MMETSP0224-20130122/23276_1 /TAXON_ID=285029 /ORGANISM="Togula jolla, Strain CCCM 725" /LENGTH=38 /DNA_ID= /DNA_START= /DNA_END= /DNA_ORIENTATION=
MDSRLSKRMLWGTKGALSKGSDDFLPLGSDALDLADTV